MKRDARGNEHMSRSDLWTVSRLERFSPLLLHLVSVVADINCYFPRSMVVTVDALVVAAAAAAAADVALRLQRLLLASFVRRGVWLGF